MEIGTGDAIVAQLDRNIFVSSVARHEIRKAEKGAVA